MRESGDANKAEFLKQAAAAFDRMMKEDQEQMITFDQMEDRALEVGAKLQIWLIEKLIEESAKKKTQQAKQAPPSCPKCQKPLQMAAAPKERQLRGRSGQVSFKRDEGYCPSCRKAFFPSGHDVEARP